MFLFISKLLPLLIYPVGLTFLLLAVAGVLSWQKSRWTFAPIVLALAVLWLSSAGGINGALVRSLELQHLPRGEMPTADAIVVLGGCTKPATPPRAFPELTEGGDRVLYAAKLYKDKKAPLIVAVGGRIPWLGGGKPEAGDIAQLLEFMGVPPSAILQESNSLNTYQNAANVKPILQQHGIGRVLLVTSALHMPRSLLVFQRQGIDAIAAPTDFLTTLDSNRPQQASIAGILFDLIPDVARIATTTQALKEYVGLLVYRLRGWA